MGRHDGHQGAARTGGTPLARHRDDYLCAAKTDRLDPGAGTAAGLAALSCAHAGGGVCAVACGHVAAMTVRSLSPCGRGWTRCEASRTGEGVGQRADCLRIETPHSAL